MKGRGNGEEKVWSRKGRKFVSQPPGFTVHPALVGRVGTESWALRALREPENIRALGHRLGGTYFGVHLLSNYCM